ncbi:Copine family protein [Tritrichomonas foetus]|uniref:Copine family protein n=1 Tax=Tritrichomonas foetus TaxID=1144522 RepID=A0A1J4K2T8_9EUKA|nr:Copine family protein [Tritrichomonas foetus]|eukprot:OHT03805.1 Copine family protein [Tritrichomonas foetus]
MNIAYGARTKTLSQINISTESVNAIEIFDQAEANPVLNIHVACKDVIKLDIGSPSDPMCVLSIPINGSYQEVARTEVIYDDPNPQWVKFFQAAYVFETHQPLRFEVYDCDSEKAALSSHDYVGYADTDVQTLVSNGATELKIELKHPSQRNKRGTLIIVTEQNTSCGSIITGKLACSKLKKMKTFSKNNPYYIIAKPSESGRDLPVFRSEVACKTFQTQFKDFQIPLQVISNGDLEAPISIQIMDFQKRKPGKLIGKASMSLSSLMEQTGRDIEIVDEKRKKTGFIKFINLQVVRKPTFYDYLRSGIQLNLVTAIDFTASNRDPRDPQSLHYIAQGQMNQYETCINNVGSVICPYDTDQLFPVYGFGGKINGRVEHCFPLTFNPSNPNVQGLPGILQAYRNSLMSVQLSGPTLFAPIIRNATQVAQISFQESRTYTILMILTDGIINDMRETIDAIVDATDSPLSIIIVGIGNADFQAMDQLDADDVPLLSSRGVRMKRDIVQFVPFTRFLKNGGFGLAEEVLAEVPKQVDDYCSTHNFIPQF